MTMTDGETIERFTDKILQFFYLCEEKDKKNGLIVPLRNMDGAYVCCEDIDPSVGDSGLRIPCNDGEPAIWPVNCPTVGLANRDHYSEVDRWPEGSLNFSRVHTIRPADARKVGASIFSHKMVADEMVICSPDGTAQSAWCPYAFMNGHWVAAAPHRITGGRGKHDNEIAVQMNIGFALALRYEWTVWIGQSDLPRISFLTDPIGVREVFRLRDIPEGKARRAALRHWVQAHWRKRRKDEEAEIWIRRHFRGATDFTWNGLRCRVNPPAFDIEQVEKERIAAKGRLRNA